MSWNTFHDRLRLGGRDAAIFVIVLSTLCIGVGVVSAMHLYQYADGFFAILAVFVAIRLCLMTKNIRKRSARSGLFEEESDSRPLSCDELRKARSKLTRNSNSLPQRRY